MALRVPDLVLRLVKGVKLTHAEMDNNLVVLRDFANSLADIIGESLNPDGTIKAKAVGEDAIDDRVVKANNLAFDSALFAVDAGSINQIKVTFDPVMTEYADGTVLFIRVSAKNSGEVTIQCDALDAIPLLKNGSDKLTEGDIATGQIICVGYYAGKFQLITGSSTAQSSADNGVTTVVYENTAALPGNGLSAVFNHNLDETPDNYSVYLQCNTLAGELGYTYGQEVPIGSFLDALGAAAFSVTATPNTIVVAQLTATVKVADLATAGNPMTAITQANWLLKVRIRKAISTAVTVQPVLQFPIGGAQFGAASYGAAIYMPLSLGLFKLDLGSARVTQIQAWAAQNGFNGMAAIKTGAGTAKSLIWCGPNGVYKLNLSSVAAADQIGFNGVSKAGYMPVAVDEVSSGGSEAHPFVYAVTSGMGAAGGAGNGYGAGAALLSTLAMKKLKTVDNTETAVGVAMNLHTLAFQNNAEFVKFEPNDTGCIVQYNPVKKRLYVFTATGYLHIFTIPSATLQDFWVLADRTVLTYLKTLTCAIGWGNNVANWRAQLAVEFDLDTGQEKAITGTATTYSNWSNSNAGSIVRVPWMEG